MELQNQTKMRSAINKSLPGKVKANDVDVELRSKCTLSGCRRCLPVAEGRTAAGLQAAAGQAAAHKPGNTKPNAEILHKNRSQQGEAALQAALKHNPNNLC